MAGMRIVSENSALRATIVPWTGLAHGTESATFPLAYSVNGQLNPECRMTSNGSGIIIIRYDFGEEITLNGVMIAKHNFKSGYGIKLIGNNDDTPFSGGGTYQIVCADTDFGKGNDNAVCFNTAFSRQYWFILIEDLDNSTEYRLPEIWLTNNTALTRQARLPATEEIGGPFRSIETFGGQRHVVKFGDSTNFPDLEWHSLTISDLTDFLTLNDNCWPHGSFWLMPVCEDSPGYFCQYNNNELIIEPDGIGIYQLKLNAEELAETVVLS